MMKPKIYATFLFSVLFLFSQSNLILAQEIYKQVGSRKYNKIGKKWFAFNDGKQGDLADTNRIVVRLKNKGEIKDIDFKSLGLPILKDVRGCFADEFYELEVPSGFDSFQIANQLEKSNIFKEVRFTALVQGHSIDPLFSNQWNLQKVNAPQAWNISTGSSSIIVAVIDGGAEYNHEDLVSNCWSGIGYDFYSLDADPSPAVNDYHGTAVAGIIAAATNTVNGIAGIAGGWGGTNGI